MPRLTKSRNSEMAVMISGFITGILFTSLTRFLVFRPEVINADSSHSAKQGRDNSSDYTNYQCVFQCIDKRMMNTALKQ
jgi:hypothetical protein